MGTRIGYRNGVWMSARQSSSVVEVAVPFRNTTLIFPRACQPGRASNASTGLCGVSRRRSACPPASRRNRQARAVVAGADGGVQFLVGGAPVHFGVLHVRAKELLPGHAGIERVGQRPVVVHRVLEEGGAHLAELETLDRLGGRAVSAHQRQDKPITAVRIPRVTSNSTYV